MTCGREPHTSAWLLSILVRPCTHASWPRVTKPLFCGCCSVVEIVYDISFIVWLQQSVSHGNLKTLIKMRHFTDPVRWINQSTSRQWDDTAHVGKSLSTKIRPWWKWRGAKQDINTRNMEMYEMKRAKCYVITEKVRTDNSNVNRKI